MYYSNCYIFNETDSNKNSSRINSSETDLLECDLLKEFVDLIYTKTYVDKNQNINFKEDEKMNGEKIIKIMNCDSFNTIYYHLNNNKHECVSFSYAYMRFDVIEFLRKEKLLLIESIDLKLIESKCLKFNVLDILFTLFKTCMVYQHVTERVYKYINYFWNWCEEENPKALVDYINMYYRTSMLNAILNGFDINIKKEYFNKFMKLWDIYYEDKDVYNGIQPTEYTDSETIILLLIRNFMSEELKYLLTRKAFNKYLYEWKFHNITACGNFSIPIVSYILQEFREVRNQSILNKLAKMLEILIEYAKILYDDIVIETPYTVYDYLDHFGYIYDNSPIFNVLTKFGELKPRSGNKINNIYTYDHNKPYDMLYKKYEYTKNPVMKTQILQDITNEQNETGISYDTFLKNTGLYDLIN